MQHVESHTAMLYKPNLDSMLFSIAMVIVTRVQLTLSATPFSCRVHKFVDSWTMPTLFRYVVKSDEKYSPLPSVQSILSQELVCHSTLAKYSLKFSSASNLFFIG